MSAESKAEDWEELDLEDSSDAIMVDVDDVEDLEAGEGNNNFSGAHGCYCH